jgi:hypothetical protein
MQNIVPTDTIDTSTTPTGAETPTTAVQSTSSSAKVAPKQASSTKKDGDQNKAVGNNVTAAPAAPSKSKAKAKTKAVRAQVNSQPVKAKTSTPKAETKAPAKTVKPKAPSAAPAKAPKEKKIKVVRDSFTLPKTELLQVAAMKKRALDLGVDVKKSELIRAGLQALSGLAEAPFKKALASIPTIKTGRPPKD